MAEINLRDYLRQIDTFVRRGNMDEAIAHARHVLAKYPKNGAAYRNLARALMGQSQWSDALEVLQRLSAAHIDDPWVQVHLGLVYRKLEDRDKALYHYERAFDLAPNDPTIIKNLRELYQERFNQPLERIHLTAGAAAGQFIQNELYDQAVNTIQQTLEQTPNRPDLKLMMAQALWQSGRFVDAAEQAFDVLRQLPYCVTANSMLAELWLQEKRPTDAQRFLSRVEDVEPYLAVEIATNDRARDELFAMEVLNYEQYAQQTLAEQRPEWLETLEEVPDDGIELDADEAESEAVAADDEAMGWLADLEPEEAGEFAQASNINLENLFGDMEDSERVISETPITQFERTSTGLTGMLGDEAAELDLEDILGEQDERFRPRKTDNLTGMLNRFSDEPEDDDFLVDSSYDEVPHTSTGLTGILSKFDDDDDDLSWLADAQTGRFDTGPLDEAKAIIAEESGEKPVEADADEIADLLAPDMSSSAPADEASFEYDSFDQFQRNMPTDNEIAFGEDFVDETSFDQSDDADEIAAQMGVHELPTLFDDETDSEDVVQHAEIDTGWFEQQQAIDQPDEPTEQPTTGTGSLDPLAWMHQSGIELSEEDEMEQPTFYEEIGDDEVSISGSEQSSMAWMQDSGIELHEDEADDYDEIIQNFTPTSRLDEPEADDSMAWLQATGAELIDNLIDDVPDIEDETSEAILDDLDWADESALEELLEMETLAETGSLSSHVLDSVVEDVDDADASAELLEDDAFEALFGDVPDDEILESEAPEGEAFDDADWGDETIIEETIIEEAYIDDLEDDAFADLLVDDDATSEDFMDVADEVDEANDDEPDFFSLTGVEDDGPDNQSPDYGGTRNDATILFSDEGLYDDLDDNLDPLSFLADEADADIEQDLDIFNQSSPLGNDADAELFDQPVSDDLSETRDWQDTMPDQPNPTDWEPEDMQQGEDDDFADLFNDFGDDDSDDLDSELDSALELDESWLEEVTSDTDLADEEDLATADADWLSEVGVPEEIELVDQDALPDMDTLEDVAELEGADWLGEMSFDSDDVGEALDELGELDLIEDTGDLVTEGNEWLQGISGEMEEATEDAFGDFDNAFADLEFDEEETGEALGELGELDLIEDDHDLVTEGNEWLQGISGEMEDSAEEAFSEFDDAFGDFGFDEEEAEDALEELEMVEDVDDLVAEGNEWLQGVGEEIEEGADDIEEAFADLSFGDEEPEEAFGELEMAEDVDELVAEDGDWLQGVSEDIEAVGDNFEEDFESFDEAFGDIQAEGEEFAAEMPSDGNTMVFDGPMASVESDLTEEESEFAVDEMQFEDPFAETFDDELPRPSGMTGLLDNIGAHTANLGDDLPDFDGSFEEAEFEEPDWLSALDDEESATPEEPEWLSSMDVDEDTADEVVEFEEVEQEAIAASVDAAEPDWLSDMGADELDEEALPGELQAIESDWLADMEPPDPEATAQEEEDFMAELEDALYSEATDEEDILSAAEAGAAALGMVAMSEGDESEDADDIFDEEFYDEGQGEEAYAYEEGRYTNRNTNEANVYTTSEIDAVLSDEDVPETEDLVASMEFGEYVDDDLAEDTGIHADNAPDWLNQMVPGLDLDFEAREDEEGGADSDVDSSHRRREAVGEVPSEDDYGWLEDIVEEETQAGAPPPIPTSVQQAVVIPPRFNFSQVPVWARNVASSVARAVTGAVGAVAATRMDEDQAARVEGIIEEDVIDDLTDLSDDVSEFDDTYDDEMFDDELDDNEIRFDDLGDYEDDFDMSEDDDSSEGTVDDLLDDLGLDLDIENFDFDDLEDDDD